MGKHRFAVGMGIYALVFLLMTAVGLGWFWGFLEGYEASRPETAVKAYTSGVTTENIIAGAEEMLGQLDGDLQSREQQERIIQASLDGQITAARISTESTAERQVYALSCGEQVIGEIAITAGAEDRYGFRPWQVTEEYFDFSHLIGEPVSVTVPEDFCVSVNGFQLEERYITETGIPYDVLEEFYDGQALPTMVTYTADGFLGQISLNVMDAAGAAVTELSDSAAFLDVCTDAEKDMVKAAMEAFLRRYVTFTGSSNDMALENYYNLRRSLVKDSALAKRLYTAIDGLTYAQSYSDEIQSMDFHSILKVEEMRYLCDVTYFVKTSGRGGVFTTENRVKVLLLDTDEGLKVEAMTRA